MTASDSGQSAFPARCHAERAEHTNFFENRATEYSWAATEGSWEEVWAEVDGV